MIEAGPACDEGWLPHFNPAQNLPYDVALLLITFMLTLPEELVITVLSYLQLKDLSRCMQVTDIELENTSNAVL